MIVQINSNDNEFHGRHGVLIGTEPETGTGCYDTAAKGPHTLIDYKVLFSTGEIVGYWLSELKILKGDSYE